MTGSQETHIPWLLPAGYAHVESVKGKARAQLIAELVLRGHHSYKCFFPKVLCSPSSSPRSLLT
jgi:hypothetical protein